jgi:hypothetical protein
MESTSVGFCFSVEEGRGEEGHGFDDGLEKKSYVSAIYARDR